MEHGVRVSDVLLIYVFFILGTLKLYTLGCENIWLMCKSEIYVNFSCFIFVFVLLCI